MTKTENLLKNHNLRITQVRKNVLSLFLDQDEALSNHFIESQLEKVDRVTLYRTLKSFEEKGLIHKAFDGSDISKYALCSSDCSEDHHQDSHAHFHCEKCGKTLCMDDIPSPNSSLPSGYQLHSTHLILKGYCNECG